MGSSRKNKSAILAFVLASLLVFSVFSTANMIGAQAQDSGYTSNSTSSSGGVPSQSQNSTSTEVAPVTNTTAESTTAKVQNRVNVTIAGEPLLASTQSISRSFSYPVLMFEGDVVSEVEVTLTWNTDGSTDIKDNRGNKFSLAIPKSLGNVTLFANSTAVAQKLVGSELQYSIYWFPVANSHGYADKYEFVIAGVSKNSTSLVFEVLDSQPAETAIIDNDSFALGVDSEFADSGAAESEVLEGLDGLVLDWSDAIKSGYETYFDSEKSSLLIPVDEGPFFVDPYIVATTSYSISPSKALAFQDQMRLATTTNGTSFRINAFYYDGSNIVYKTSDDDGDTWSSPISLSTGAIASSTNRWTITPSASTDGTEYVHVFYWTKSGSTTTVKTKRGTVNGLNITWDSPVQIFTITNNESCSPGACVGVTTSPDGNGTIYAAFAWNTTGGTFSLVIKKSSNNGVSWSDSLSQINGFAGNTPGLTLTNLNATKMLFVYAKGESAALFYRVFDGSSWGSEQTVSSNGMAAWTRKQLSSVYSELDAKAYIAYTNVTLTSGGILKVARFFANGTFDGVETADSTLRHYLPNIMPVVNGDININSIANNKIYNVRKVGGTWGAPFNPYGTSFISPDDLTATTLITGENAALWKEGTSSPYNVTFGLLHDGTVELYSSAQNSPGYADYFEGERRVMATSDGTLFAFYYDGTHIVYKVSQDLGHTWSSGTTSTGTGQLTSSDNYRWSIAYGEYSGNERISLLYYKLSGSNTDFFAKTFSVNGTALNLVSTDNMFSVANDASCSPTGVCAAASGASDSDGVLYAAFSYKTGGTWYKKVMKSSNGGDTWVSSMGTSSVTSSGSRLPITITKLESGKMLLVWAKYDSSSMFYRVYDGSAWGTSVTKSGIGWSSNTVKQISSGTADRGLVGGSIFAYVVFLSSGNQGAMKVAEFSRNGSFVAVETADSTITHWLPSLSIANDGTVHAYSLYNNVIYETVKTENVNLNPGFEFVNLGSEQLPSAYWQFENSTLDDSGNDNNGTLYGNAAITNELKALVGTSLYLDGAGDYMRVADSSSIDISGNLTVSAWVRLDQQTSDFRTIVGKGGAYRLEKNNNNLPRFIIWSGGISTPPVLGTTTLEVGKWYHIAATYDGANLRMYVNGVLEGTQARSGTISTNNNDLFIGSTNSSAQFLNATLDDILIYDKALNQDQIWSIGNGWNLRGAHMNSVGAIFGHVDMMRQGVGDTRSIQIPASSGKVYTLRADVLVTSGFAKIELDFLNASGFWLTNNTLPSSGTSATSTTGSVQTLSASWTAPSNTASMIVRLINNVTAGSSRFDNIRLTNWESPIAPYGTDQYYPDQLTSTAGSPHNTGTLWREGTSSPYDLFYGGITKPTPNAGYITCYHYVLYPNAKCKGTSLLPIKAYGETAYTYQYTRICPGSVSKICVYANFMTKYYARQFYASGKMWFFNSGNVKACAATGCPIQVNGVSWTSWGLKSVALNGAPYKTALWIFVTYKYKTADGVYSRTYSALWDLKFGYG